MDYKDIYLRKPGEKYYVGLHSVGEENATWQQSQLDGSVVTKSGFLALESWGNEYDENGKMMGKGSFRVFGDIDEAAVGFVQDGYEIFTLEKK